MIDALTRVVVWAEFDVFESLARGFRPENKALSLGDLLIILVFVVAVLTAAWVASHYLGRFDPQRRIHNPRALFTELCRAHALAWPQRRLLQRLAREQRLDVPAMLFIEPERFDPSRWSGALRARQRDLEQIRRRLFGEEYAAEPVA